MAMYRLIDETGKVLWEHTCGTTPEPPEPPPPPPPPPGTYLVFGEYYDNQRVTAGEVRSWKWKLEKAGPYTFHLECIGRNLDAEAKAAFYYPGGKKFEGDVIGTDHAFNLGSVTPYPEASAGDYTLTVWAIKTTDLRITLSYY